MEFRTLKISPKLAVLESVRAQTKLLRYIKDNNLESAKANLNHPIHGPIIKEYLRIIQYGNNKLNELKQEIMKTRKEKKAKEKLANEVKVKKGSSKKLKKPVVKVEPSKNRVFTTYDYPTIDGKELSSDLKKKYRAKIRSLMKSQMTKEEATKRATFFIKEESIKPKDNKQKPEKESKSRVEKKDKVSKKKDLQSNSSSESKKSNKPKKKTVKEED